MDEARKKLRLWLAFVVAAAVIIGLVYYLTDGKRNGGKSEGTLVRTETAVIDRQEKETAFSQTGWDRRYLNGPEMERVA